MQKHILGVLLFLISVQIFGQRNTGDLQDNGDVVFEDGKVYNFKMLQNDPDIRVDWTAMGFFRPVYFDKLITLTAGAQVRANLYDKVELYGQVAGGFHIDVNMPDDEGYKSFKKQYQHHFLETSIKLFETESAKNTGILLGEVRSGGMITSYMVRGKLKFKNRYGLVAGIDYSQRRVGSGQFYDGPISDTNIYGSPNHYYSPLNLYQTSLRLGIDITSFTSSLVEIDGVRRVDYQHGRFYTVLLLPINQRLDVVKYSTNIIGAQTAELVDEDQYSSPGFSGLGCVIGAEILNEMSRSGGYFGITFEVGILPGLKYDKTFDNFTASLGLSVGLGTKLAGRYDGKK